MPGNPHNHSPFEDLFEDLLNVHFDKSKIGEILDNQKTLLANDEIFMAKLSALADQQIVIATNVLLIKAFWGIGDSLPLSAEDQKALDDVTKASLDVERQAEGIDTKPPA